MSEREHDEERKGGVGLKERGQKKVQKPRRYKVILHNDDFTPVDWVAGLVRQVFRKNDEDAMRITMQVHEQGVAVAGVYTHEIAETKCVTVHQFATKDGHPLICTMEPEE